MVGRDVLETAESVEGVCVCVCVCVRAHECACVSHACARLRTLRNVVRVPSLLLQCNTMHQRNTMEYSGIQWNTIEYNGMQWNTME